MTIEEIKSSDAIYLRPVDIAPILECDPHAIRLAARENPSQLFFPVIRIGKRTKIPRIPFLQALGYEVTL